MTTQPGFSEIDRAGAFIDSLSHERKVAFIARLVYELTLSGRAYYSLTSKGLDSPVILREINEIQHQLSAQLMNLLQKGSRLRPWSQIAALFLQSDIKERAIPGEIRSALIHTLAAFVNYRSGDDQESTR